jgi:hypothetical protein
MRSIRSITCRAELDEVGPELEAARERAASGDPSWEQWVREYDAGQALILRLHVTISFDAGGKIGEVGTVNYGIWVEQSPHPPAVAGQLQAVASKDFNHLSGELHERGIEVTANDLAEMQAQVELSDDVMRLLDSRPQQEPRGLRPEAGELTA